MKKLVLIGGGGHCRSVIDSLAASGYDDIAICDIPNRLGQQVCGVSISFCDDDLPKLIDVGYTSAFITLGSVGNCTARKAMFEQLRQIGFYLPTVIDRTAIVSAEATVECGSFVGKGAIINAGASVGQCCIINSGAIIEHDCRVGNFAHIAPGATLLGAVIIGENSHIGANATVLQSMQIGRDCLIGAGSVVTRNIPVGIKAFGNPCREVSEH